MSNSRVYRSSLREERARETRLRIRESARDLFADRGFTETTVTEIAASAGVSPQTVYAVFGNKAGIVADILVDLEESADLPAWVARMIAEPDPAAQSRIFAEWLRTFFGMSAPILRAAMSAAGDPNVAVLGARGDANRLEGARKLTAMWHSRSALRAGLDAEGAAQRMWLITSAETYLAATDRLGWSPDEYEGWVGDAIGREVLGIDPAASR